ncbi:MAG TPA: hypothetical protein VN030_13575 [Cellvibrio sp.]|nr:hypothetical protein [Cellvibrio sp.]
MQWHQVSQYFSGDPNDLIEIYFHAMDAESWRKLFDWLEGKVIYLRDQYNVDRSNKLNLNAFLTGERCYIADIQTPLLRLSLAIIDDDLLTIDIEKGDIQSQELFADLLSSVNIIAEVVGCKDYIICPEFKKAEAFVVNGVVVAEAQQPR